MLCINNDFKIISPYVYTASIDLTDAFFVVPIHSIHQYLKLTFYYSFQLLHACQYGYEESLLKYLKYQLGTQLV